MKKTIIAVLGLTLSACAANNLNPDNIHLQTTNYLKEIRATDSVKNGRMTVNITGETYEDTTFYYRVAWFDYDGMKLDTRLSKSTMSKVRRNSPFTWSVIAPNETARSYQVYVSDRVIEQ